MELVIARPDGAGPFSGFRIGMHNPAHVSLADDLFTSATAERFAAEGYVSVTPNPYHRWPADEPIGDKREQLGDKNILTYLNAGLAHLSDMPNVDAAPLGVTGYCFGGMRTWRRLESRSSSIAMTAPVMRFKILPTRKAIARTRPTTPGRRSSPSSASISKTGFGSGPPK